MAKAIGDEATNAWIEGTPTLGDKLDDALKQQPELMKGEKKKLILKQNILRQINAL